MIRAIAGLLAGVFAMPLLVVGGFGSTVTAVSAGDDTAQVAAAPPELQEHFQNAARRFALPPALLVAIAEVESGFHPNAVGPPVPGGPALGMMQFLPDSGERFNVVADATPFQPGPAVLAAANHLLYSGRLPGGAWDAAQALYGYNHSLAYVQNVLARAAAHGYHYSPSGPPADPDRYVFPVLGPNTYGAAHHDYPATDIFAAIGVPIVAAVRSEVLRTSPTEVGKGGITATLRGEDGWRYYYAHLDSLDPAIRPGIVVDAGTVLGRSGNTGNARTTPPHLHLGISKTGSVAGEISPYPYLRLWQSTT